MKAKKRITVVAEYVGETDDWIEDDPDLQETWNIEFVNCDDSKAHRKTPSICLSGCREIWNLPQNFNRLWFTVTNFKPRGKGTYRLRRHFGKFTCKYGLLGSAQAALDVAFPDDHTVWVSVHTE